MSWQEERQRKKRSQRNAGNLTSSSTSPATTRMAFRTKDKLRFTDRSVFNRAAFACLSGIGAVGSLMSAIWLGIAVSSPNQLDFLDLPLSAGDAGFWFAAMSCITVILICLACLLMRSALTFRRAWSQEALNLLFMDCKIEQMIEKLDPPSSTPTAKP